MSNISNEIYKIISEPKLNDWKLTIFNDLKYDNGIYTILISVNNNDIWCHNMWDFEYYNIDINVKIYKNTFFGRFFNCFNYSISFYDTMNCSKIREIWNHLNITLEKKKRKNNLKLLNTFLSNIG